MSEWLKKEANEDEELGVAIDLASNEYVDLGGDIIQLISTDKAAAQHQGKNVSLNSPRHIHKGEPGYGRKDYVVYVRSGDRIKKIMFGDPKLGQHPKSPERRKSFFARHRCHLKKDKTTPGYWACHYPPNW